jgi:hypothetical protein
MLTCAPLTGAAAIVPLTLESVESLLELLLELQATCTAASASSASFNAVLTIDACFIISPQFLFNTAAVRAIIEPI